jgi:cell division protein ZapA
MEELGVKIKIGGRIYPMKVQATDEARVRKAAALLHEQAKAYSDQFNIHDQQDLLAMVTFDCLVETLKAKETITSTMACIAQVDALVQRVDEVMHPASN